MAIEQRKSMPGRATEDRLHVDIGALSQRVLGHEQSLAEFKTQTSAALQSISQQIQGIASTMEGRMRTPWATVFTGLGLVATIFVAFIIQPINHEIEGVKSQITAASRETVQDLRGLREGNVSWREHQLLLDDFHRERAAARHEIERLSDRVHEFETLFLKRPGA